MFYRSFILNKVINLSNVIGFQCNETNSIEFVGSIIIHWRYKNKEDRDSEFEDILDFLENFGPNSF
jgi:hypothetical protein